MKLTIRKARPQDAPFVALVMCEAVGKDIMERSAEGISPEQGELLELLTRIASRDDTLYSWRNTTLLVNEQDAPVAGLIAYAGEGYLERRQRTFAMAERILDFDPETMDLETRDGEYYLDSLAVLPAYRGAGLGRRLLNEGIRVARQMQRPAILACAPDNTGAKALYESLGFREQGHFLLFGEDYLRMVCESPPPEQ